MLVSGASTGPKAQDIPNTKKTLGREDFLLLLVTQLKNQDPLSPMSNEDFIAQTAQFTSLETLEKINENIVESNQDSALMRNMFATSMIGKEIKVNTNKISLLNGNTTGIEFDIPQGSEAFVSIRDQASGLVVRDERISDVTGNHKYIWDGRDNRGNTVGDGVYSVLVQASDSSGGSNQLSPVATGRVSGKVFRSA